MKKALSCEGLGPIKNLEELATLASNNGFSIIDAGPALVRDSVNRLGIDGVRRLLDQLCVQIGSFPSSAWWIDSSDTFLHSINTLNEDARLYKKLGCEICHTFVMPCSDQNQFNWTAIATRRIRLISDLLSQNNIRLALEYVGPHHMREQRKHKFIYTAQQTLDWISLIERQNVGLLLDTFHWYTAQETIDDLRAIPTDKIYHVHLNDAPSIPVEQIADNNRLYPGEGVIDLKAFITVLREKNYNGIVAQEVLQPEMPQQSNEDLAKKSQQAFNLFW